MYSTSSSVLVNSCIRPAPEKVTQKVQLIQLYGGRRLHQYNKDDFFQISSNQREAVNKQLLFSYVYPFWWKA